MYRDLRRALRIYGRRPAFSIFAILSLSLGIGANAAIFSVANHLLWNPLPFDGGDRIVHLMQRHPRQGFVTNPSPALREAWRAGVPGFDAIEFYSGQESALLGGREPRIISEVRVSGTLMERLGVPMVVGRPLTLGDVGTPVTVIDERLWRQDFAGRLDVNGQTIRLDGIPHTIVGVRRGGFELPMTIGGPDVWTPLGHAPEGERSVAVLARIEEGVSIEQARTALRQIDAAAGADDLEWAPDLLPHQRFLGRGFATRVWMLFGAVGLVLLIACANVANMLLAAGLRRSQELAVRMALGASRWRIIRQLLAENLVLGVAAAGVAVLIGRGVLGAIVALRPDQLGQIAFVRMDGSTIVFACTLAVATNALVTLVPAFRISHLAPALVLVGSRGASGASDRPLIRKTLLALQVALAVVLFVGAGTAARTYWELRLRDPGFDPERLGAIRFTLPEDRYPDAGARRAWYQSLLDELRGKPQLESVSRASAFVGWMEVAFGAPIAEGEDTPPVGEALSSVATVEPGYLETVGIPVVEGRGFTADDEGHLAVINETMARRYWPDGSAVGRRFRLPDRTELATIVGVVSDVYTFGLRTDDQQIQVHFLDQTGDAASASFVVRGRIPFAQVLPELRETVWRHDGDLPISYASSAEEVLTRAIAQERFTASLVTALAVLALFLAGVGVYGVVALLVSLRMKELGIRVALGARKGHIGRTLLAAGLGPVVTGLAAGMAAALGLQRVIRHILPDMGSGDPMLFAAAGLTFVSVTAIACTPSWFRAMSVAPAAMLRQE